MSVPRSQTMEKIFFFGTPAFSVPALEALADAGYQLRIVTREDKPVGRGLHLAPPAVKVAAQRLGIPFEQPRRLDGAFLRRAASWHPDAAVLAAYGKLIRPDLLALPMHGFVNVHPSLLPRHRGASPVAATILAGDAVTGVTLLCLDEGLDTGPILAQEEMALQGNETCGELTAKLASRGARLLVRTLPAFLRGEIRPLPQDASRATSTELLTKDSGKIDWSKPAAAIERMVRAYHPWPTAWTVINKRRMKLLRASVGDASSRVTGTIVKEAGLLGVICGDHIVLLLTEVHPEGGKPLPGESFAHGFHTLLGQQIEKVPRQGTT